MLACALFTMLLLVMPAASSSFQAGSPFDSPGMVDEPPYEQLPDCSVVPNSASQPLDPEDLMLVSTLDGKVTALDPNGQVVWQIDTGTPLLSSSPKTLSLEGPRGEKATCIPSLDGSLYLFDGKNVQLFLTAELLLRNSLKTGPLVLTGGKEIKTFGIDARSGQIRYICTMDGGCLNLTDSDGKVGASETDDVVVIRRHTQTVRAIEPKSGTERWHFSVAENELQFVSSNENAAGCGRMPTIKANGHRDFGDSVRVMASKGIISSINKDNSELTWTIELNSPVVGAWKLRDYHLEEIDLFEPANLIGMDHRGPRPFLHLGVYQQQFYVHQNPKTRLNSPPGIEAVENNGVRLMLEHSLASDSALAPIEGCSGDLVPQMLQGLYDNPESSNGIYFVLDDSIENNDQQLAVTSEPQSTNALIDVVQTTTNSDVIEESADETPIIYAVYSIWHYWREIAMISILMSVAVNVFMTRVMAYLGIGNVNLIPQSPAPSTPGTESTTGPFTESSRTLTGQSDDRLSLVPTGSVSSEPPRTPELNFVSRFTTDFEPIRCLGKGGFGIVFESRNKIDDCSYAVKRIRLPSKKSAREKVLREVKALAKLDHPHIVRYYNAWLETPPVGWQDVQDDAWKTSLPLSNTTNAFSLEAGTGVASTETSSDLLASKKAPKTNGGAASMNPFRVCDDLFESSERPVNGGGEYLSQTESWFGEDDDDSAQGDELINEHNIDEQKEDSIIFQSSSGDQSVMLETRASEIHSSRSTHRAAVAESRIDGNDDIVAVCQRPRCLPLEEASLSQTVYLYIQMQLCRKESLKDWLASRATLELRGHEKVLDIFYQISGAVEYVHNSSLIHRDLKPSNIFFATADDIVKVGDFGLVTGTDKNVTFIGTPSGVVHSPKFDGSDATESQLTDKVGTQLYMSPEQVTGNKYSEKVDIYSLGLILFELIWTLPTQMERVQTLSKVKKLNFPKAFKKKFSLEYQLVRSMVAADPSIRPSAQEVRKHSLFEEIREDSIPQTNRRRTTSTRTSLSSQEDSAK